MGIIEQLNLFSKHEPRLKAPAPLLQLFVSD